MTEAVRDVATLAGAKALGGIEVALAAFLARVEIMRGEAGVSPPDRTDEIKETCAAWIGARSDAARAAIETKLVALVDSLTDERSLAAAEAAVAIAIAPLPDVVHEEVAAQVAAIPRIEGKPGKDAVAKDGEPGKDGKPGLIWRRQWKAGRTYEKGDAVEDEGSSYIVIAATTRERPSESARDWDLLAKAGKDGKPGMIVVGGGAASGGVAGSVAWDDVTGKPAGFPADDDTLARLLALEEAVGINLQITNTAPDAEVGSPYSHQYTRAFGTAPFVWTAEGLPAGWEVSADGLLTGPGDEAVTLTFTVTVTGDLGSVASLDEVVEIAYPAIQFTGTLADGQQGSAYSDTIAVSGGDSGPYTITASSGLPDGVSVAMAGDDISFSGTPTELGPFAVSVTVEDAHGNEGVFEDSITLAPDIPANAITTDDGDPITLDDGTTYVTTDS